MKQSFAKDREPPAPRGPERQRRHPRLAERQRTVILADAERDALRVRGEGDAIATQTYARAYSKNPELLRPSIGSLQAYERSLGKDGDLLVVTPGRGFLQVSEGSVESGLPRGVSARAACRLWFNDLLAALGLFLCWKACPRFSIPRREARVRQAPGSRDRELRIAGLGSMLVGIIILFPRG